MTIQKLSSTNQTPTAIIVAVFTTLLVGCATAPPPAPPPAQVQALVALPPSFSSKLIDLGFEKTDEGYVLNLPGPLLFETGSDVLSQNATTVHGKLASDLRN